MLFFRIRIDNETDGVCYIDENKIVGMETYERRFGHGWFKGSRIILEGGGEVVVRSSPEEVIAAIEASLNPLKSEREQIGWYHLGEKRFCYMDEREVHPKFKQHYTIPVFIEAKKRC